MRKLLLTVAVLLSVVCSLWAKDRQFVKGTLTNVAVGQRMAGIPTQNGGTFIAQHNIFQVLVTVGDLTYTGETRSRDVRKLTIGDPVDVCIEEKDFILRAPDGDEIKARLLTKSRVVK
jgi:hypothetical protein